MPAQLPYLWQQPDWPHFTVDAQALAGALAAAHLQQGRLLGLMDAIGLAQAQSVSQELWVQETLATAAIEGEKLDLDAVRSSVGHRLGLADKPAPDRNVDGLVLVMQDATDGYQKPLDADRLCRWQSALFPGGTSGLQRIAVGRYRDHADLVQIVSGRLGREVVHYTALASADVAAEMAQFLAWFEATRPPQAAPALGGLARAAVAHLWFETIHPFEDGNGRLGRAIVDLALAQDLDAPVRLFGMSRQMLVSRAGYYDALNLAQRGGLDVTPWVQWFVQAFTAGCVASQAVVRQAVDKAPFRLRAAGCALNARQIKVLDRLLEAGSAAAGAGFLGGMTSEKYAKMAAISKVTASRDLTDLLGHGLLVVLGQGKATRYAVNVPGWNVDAAGDVLSRLTP